MTEIKMITLTIDGHDVSVPAGSTVMQAAQQLAIEVPHFCYHKRLSVAGNCRMCLMEVQGGPPKPIASCAFPASEGMVVKTNSPMVEEARKGTMEFLLVNHPLDCPECDQGGECDLQDLSVAYGSDRSHFKEVKNTKRDLDIGPKIETVMTRCINCTRCVRFATEIAGVEEFGQTGRGVKSEIGTYVESALSSELAGNMIDLCPVGALTSKPYRFKGRPWELTNTASIDVMDALGTNINVQSRAGKVMRILPRENDKINEEWMSDTARFGCDGLYENRLTHPLVKQGRGQKTASWTEAFDKIKGFMKGKKEVAGLAGPLHSVEDLYAFNAFLKQTVGTDHVDARPAHSPFENGARTSYLFNVGVEGLDQADAIFLIGANPRFEAPVLNARIRKNVINRGVKVYNLGEKFDLTYAYEHLGESPVMLETLAKKTSKFAKAFSAFKNPVIIVGKEALNRKDSLPIMRTIYDMAKAFSVVRGNWNGLSILHSGAGSVPALDLAVHPENGGKNMVKIAKAAADKKIDVLFIYGDVEVSAEDLRGAKKVVYIGTHKTEYAEMADVVLPAAAYTEKTALWVNMEGRLQEGEMAVYPMMNAKEDWKIFRALSAELGQALPFDTQAELRNCIFEKMPKYNIFSDDILIESFVEPSFVSKDKILVRNFKKEDTAFYLTNEILKASKTMHECQQVANGTWQPSTVPHWQPLENKRFG